MTTKIYPKWKELIAGLGIGVGTKPTGTLKAALIDTGTYTYSDTHDFYNDVSGVVGTPTAIGSPTVTNGVLDGADVTFTAVTGASVEAYIVFLDSGTAATSPLVTFTDNRVQVEVAVDAATSATNVVTEDLPEAIASGVAMTKVSGTGPTTITTSAGAAAGARAVSVTAIASGITAGALYEYATGSGLPITPNGGDITLAFAVGGIAIL